MVFSVLAVDYDGTIAESGELSPEVRTALANARERGIVVVVATGRILDDLRAAAGDLSFANAIVAENGAVLQLPGAPPRLLGRAAPSALLEALERERIPFRSGRCVVEGNAEDAGRMLGVIRALELPLVLTFNRSRVMALPVGVCKSAGVREALRAFRLSTWNMLAIGDAENDHDLLDVAGYGAAVEWGSPALKSVADGVVPGRGPTDVAAWLHGITTRMRLPTPRAPRRTVTLGSTRDGRPVELAIRGRNLLLAGDPRSGKSWAAGLLCEQLALLGYSLCVIDPEGDYAPLEALPGVVVLGGSSNLPDPRDVLRTLNHPDVSVVLDLSRADHDAKTAYLRELLPHLVRFRRASGLPHRVVLDEAHYFLDRPDAKAYLELELGGWALVTYRVSELAPAVLETMDAVVMTHTSDPRELGTLAALSGRKHDASFTALLGQLAIDEAALVRAVGAGEARVERFRLAPRLTAHVRHRAKYRDVPLPPERGFVLTSGAGVHGPPARTLREFVVAVGRAPPESLDGHARRGDFSRWIADVFGDRGLATEIAHLEERHRDGEVVDLGTALAEAISLRYDVGV